MDLIVKTNIVPQKGETTLGQHFKMLPGGKGANQAVAAARLGEKVQMIACVGDDVYGQKLKTHLKDERVDVTNVATSNTSTGIANIILSDYDNRIIVVPGANYDLTAETIFQLKDSIKRSKIVVVQLEILPNTVKALVEICNEFNIPLLLNPAPAKHFDYNLISGIGIMTPNENECRKIFGMDMEKALEKYPNKLIVTLGKDGAQYFDGINHIRVPGLPADVIDTTGAGDTFNGALAYARVNHYNMKDAVIFANAAAALSVEKLGAQAGMPTKNQVDKLLDYWDRRR